MKKIILILIFLVITFTTYIEVFALQHNEAEEQAHLKVETEQAEALIKTANQNTNGALIVLAASGILLSAFVCWLQIKQNNKPIHNGGFDKLMANFEEIKKEMNDLKTEIKVLENEVKNIKK